MGDHGQVGRLGGDEFKAVLPGTGRHRLAGIARADADRAGLAALQHRRPPGDDRRVGRHCHRRPRPLPAPTAWSATPISRFMRPRMRGAASIASTNRRCTPSERPPGAGERPSPGDRPRRAVGRLPADRPLPTSEAVCGFEALVRWDAPASRADFARKVHPARRGMRAHLRASAHGCSKTALDGSGELARAGPHRGQFVADPVQRPRQRRRGRIAARTRPAFAPSGSSSRSPRACSSPKAIRPTTRSRA